jgi:hypothetical protein
MIINHSLHPCVDGMCLQFRDIGTGSGLHGMLFSYSERLSAQRFNTYKGEVAMILSFQSSMSTLGFSSSAQESVIGFNFEATLVNMLLLGMCLLPYLQAKYSYHSTPYCFRCIHSRLHRYCVPIL